MNNYLINKGSSIASLNSIPSVWYLSLVLGPQQSSNLTEYPTYSHMIVT